MPELPELEVTKRVLRSNILGKRIDQVTLLKASGIIIRNLARCDLVQVVVGSRIDSIDRRGKFLLFTLIRDQNTPLFLVVNPKLTGRLQLAKPDDRLFANTHIRLLFQDGLELRYFDSKKMGQVYLTQDLALVPDFSGMGPDALEVSMEDFAERLRPFRGEIKGILTRGEFIAGIGNAYADEILWRARIHPFRKRTQLSRDEIGRLYNAVGETLTWAIDRLAPEMGQAIHTEPRGFMQVHMRSGQPCPRCGSTISVIQAKQRITNFCRTCQPGGLIRGM